MSDHMRNRAATIVVGGAGGGIGTAVSTTVAATGAPVGVLTVDAGHAAAITDDIETAGGRCIAEVVDVTDDDAFAAALDTLIGRLGPTRSLVNVVGGSLVDDWYRIEDLPMEAFDRILARNLRYALQSCQALARHVIAADDGDPAGASIVNISSIAAKGTSLLAAYAASKAGLESATRSMALEWGPAGIRVNCVAAGTIVTPRSGTKTSSETTNSIPLRRRGNPADIAAATAFLLSDAASYITGHVLTVDGGASVGPGGQTLPSAVTNPAVRDRMG